MELKLIRKIKTEQSTIGDLYVNDKWECHVLEDKDRGLDSITPLNQLKQIKVFGKTAIPTGKYEVAINFSNHFQKRLPLLLNVPGFEGIRIHSGNTEKDSEGCLLVGKTHGKDVVYESREAFYDLFQKVEKAVYTEKVFITIE